MTVPALLNIALEKEGKKKKLLQQGVFVFGHPSKYCLRPTGLNFFEQTKHVAVLVVYWLHGELKFLKWAKVSKREKISDTAWLGK